ncbi:MAG: methylated-DNA--protein-cysteine methyltransferase [Chitinophagales bacterium]|nr:MAG: methylated-DNA--protein-cysteine methyltransferase [Chitinophagales bacterium]
MSHTSARASFYQRVYQVVRQIPRGRVSTYGAIARFLGTGKSARLVGWAMNSSGSVFPPVPAHRVVNRNGLLTGQHHFAYPGQMQELLENEGITVVNNHVKDFEKIFWDPAKELRWEQSDECV